MWWKFKKHRLALIGTLLLAIFAFIAMFAEFLSPYTPTTRSPNYLHGRPQVLHFVDAEGNFHLRPFTYALTAAMDPETFLLEVIEDTSDPWPVHFFVKGVPYKMWGFIEFDLHLFGVKEGHLHLLGTDQLGRDILSRLFHATRTSLTIGVVGLFISFFLGLIIGGVSGFFGGGIDDAIQRFIEFIRSIPTLPLWMALAAALPRDWSPQRVYFTITILLGLLGWTHLARRVRGKLLSLREEDFVVAARIVAIFPELYHCGPFDLIPIYDPGRDLPVFHWPGSTGTGDLVGCAPAGRTEHPGHRAVSMAVHACGVRDHIRNGLQLCR
jgi:peptide/nickel transport system permease protein